MTTPTNVDGRAIKGDTSTPVTIMNGGASGSGGGIPTQPSAASAANTPAIISQAGNVLVPNPSGRKLWTLQNLGTNPLFVRLGGTASSTVFHFILKACAVASDGSGGFISDELWKGTVSVAGTSPSCVVCELT